MALSTSVENSLKEAEQHLRNALAFAARQEKPYVASAISTIICKIESLVQADQLMDKMEGMFNKKGDHPFGGMF